MTHKNGRNTKSKYMKLYQKYTDGRDKPMKKER